MLRIVGRIIHYRYSDLGHPDICYFRLRSRLIADHNKARLVASYCIGNTRAASWVRMSTVGVLWHSIAWRLIASYCVLSHLIAAPKLEEEVHTGTTQAARRDRIGRNKTLLTAGCRRYKQPKQLCHGDDCPMT